MERFAMAVALGPGLLLLAGQADAQWRYTDDKGVSRVTQYKIDVPGLPRRGGVDRAGRDRQARAERGAGPRRPATGTPSGGIVTAEAGLVRFRNMPAPARPARTGRVRQADGLHVRLGRAAGHDLAGHLEGRRRAAAPDFSSGYGSGRLRTIGGPPGG